MLLVTLLAICLFAAVNYRIGGKVLVYPPVVFSLVWAADLFLLWVSGDYFYPVSAPTLILLCCGCLVFSAGSALALVFPQRVGEEELFSKSSYRILLGMVLIVVIAVPFCYRWIMSLSSGYAGTWLGAARVATVDLESGGDTSLFSVAVIFANLVAIFAFCEKEKHKKLWWIAIGAALALNLMTGGRAGFTILCFALLGIDWLKTRRIRWKALLVIMLLFVVTFTAIAIYVGKGDASSELSLAENVKPVAQGFVLYASGPLVALDRVVREPRIVPYNWVVYRSIIEVAHAVDRRVEVPPRHAEYVTVGPGGMVQNVYTFYFVFMDLGYGAAMAFILAFGFLITRCYQAAINGSKIALPLYGFLFACLLISIFADSLAGNVSILLRLYVMAWAIYRFPAAWLKFRRSIGWAAWTKAASGGRWQATE